MMMTIYDEVRVRDKHTIARALQLARMLCWHFLK